MSFKATSIIYAPLVFIVHSTFREVKDVKQKLRLIVRNDVTWVLTWYALILIVLFVVKLLLMNSVVNFADWWNHRPATRFLALYVAPAEIPRWQLVSLANCVLALVFMWFVRRALVRIEEDAAWPETYVVTVLRWFRFVRPFLTFYIIACTSYITLRAAQAWELPRLGEKWFPWW